MSEAIYVGLGHQEIDRNDVTEEILNSSTPTCPNCGSRGFYMSSIVSDQHGHPTSLGWLCPDCNKSFTT